MNTGIRHGTIGGGTISASSNTNANSNLVGPTGSLVFNQLGPSDSRLPPWMDPIQGTGASKPQTNPLDIMVGIGDTTSAFATAGVNAGVDAGVIAIPPSSGLAQPVQTGTIASAATPTQRLQSFLDYEEAKFVRELYRRIRLRTQHSGGLGVLREQSKIYQLPRLNHASPRSP